MANANDVVQCAHRGPFRYKTEEKDGRVISEHWFCDGCGTEFTPRVPANTKIEGEINDPAPQAEVLAKLVMAMMKKQGITEMNISEQNFRDCNGWMFTLEQRIKHGAAVLTIVMSRVPAKQTGN